MALAYKALCKSLVFRGPAEESDLCCLCFVPVDTDANDAISVNDRVTIDSDLTQNILVEELMARILVYTLGEKVVETMSVYQSVCKKCSVDAINCYNFMRKSRENINSLVQAVDDLGSCFDNLAEDVDQYETLYVAINPNNMSIQQLYDTRKISDTDKPIETQENKGKERFKYLAYGTPIKSKKTEDRTNRPRDFSTIFIKTHELVADPNNPKEYKCKLCLKTYPNSGNLRQHFFSVHFKKEFPCDLCSKSFGTAGLLQSHVSISHVAIECQVCGKMLMNRTSTMRRHALIHKKSLKICNRCGRAYKKGKDFERHMAQDTCEVPSRAPGNYQCDSCQYHCNYKTQLLNHIKYEHTDAEGFMCEWCNKKCYSKSALKTHILKHTREKNFVCTECGGKFVTRQSLTNHMRLHTGERPYPCDQCDQSFLSASRRKDHIERYHIEATYDCDMCNAKYTARRSLVKHKRRHFNEDLQAMPEIKE